jgi:small subunit ribosomal protein S6
LNLKLVYNQQVMSNKYDLTLILKSDIKDEAKDKFVEKLEKTLKALDGRVEKTMEMGKKQLAYKLNGHSEGIYLNVVLELASANVVQLQKKLEVDKDIIRSLLVKAEAK